MGDKTADPKGRKGRAAEKPRGHRPRLLAPAEVLRSVHFHCLHQAFSAVQRALKCLLHKHVRRRVRQPAWGRGDRPPVPLGSELHQESEVSRGGWGLTAPEPPRLSRVRTFPKGL